MVQNSRPDICCAVAILAQNTNTRFNESKLMDIRSINKVVDHLKNNMDLVLNIPNLMLSLCIFAFTPMHRSLQTQTIRHNLATLSSLWTSLTNVSRFIEHCTSPRRSVDLFSEVKLWRLQMHLI